MYSESEDSWNENENENENEEELSMESSEHIIEILFEKTKTTKDIYCQNCGIEIPKNSHTLKRLKKISKNYENFSEDKFYCVNCKICPNLHNLNYSYGLDNILNKALLPYAENTYFCDICDTTYEMKDGDKVLKCLFCEYDICPVCEKKYYFCF